MPTSASIAGFLPQLCTLHDQPWAVRSSSAEAPRLEQDPEAVERPASLVLELRSPQGTGIAQDVTHLAWSDAGGQALLAAATSHSVAIFSLHRFLSRNGVFSKGVCGRTALSCS